MHGSQQEIITWLPKNVEFEDAKVCESEKSTFILPLFMAEGSCYTWLSINLLIGLLTRLSVSLCFSSNSLLTRKLKSVQIDFCV